MVLTLKELAQMVKHAEPSAMCHVVEGANQIIVRFGKRPEVEIALLLPLQQRQIAKGHLDEADLSELLFSVRRIANQRF